MKSKQFLASEHPWAKKLPKGWRYEFLVDLISDFVDNRGRSVPTSDFGIPLIATNCISNNSLYPVFKNIRYVSQKIYDEWFRDGHSEPNDILFANKGEYCGKLCLTPSPVNFCFAQDMIGLKVNGKKISFAYLLGILRTKFMQEQIYAFHVGSLIPHVRKTDFDKIIVPIPPKETEEFLGEYYLTLSKKIENLQNQNKILDQITQAIYKSWFVDFDGVTEFEDSELGRIPKGWKIIKQKEVARFCNGRAYKFEEFLKYGTPIVRIQNLTGTKKFVYSDLELDEDKYIEFGDLVYAWSATFGPYIWNGPRAIYHYHIWKIICDEKKMGKIFFYYKLKQISDSIRQQGTGSIMDHITKELMENYLILLPTIEEQKRFHKISVSIFNKIGKNRSEIEKLKQIRDLLFPKLMSGEIRV